MIKNKIKHPIIGILAVLLLLTLTGCSSARESISSDGGYGVTAPGAPTPMQPPMTPGYTDGKGEYESPVQGEEGSEKVITTYRYNLETEEFEKSQTTLKALLDEYQGYAQYSDVGQKNHYSEQKYRVGTYVYRVPSGKASEFVSKLSTVGQILNENTGSTNVTNQYQDLEARIKSLQTQETRLNELFSKAEKIEDIITLEARINTVIYEKESLQRQVQNMDKDVRETTVEISLTEVLKITPKEDVKTAFGERLSNAFTGSWNSFKDATANLIISIIYLLPWFVAVAVFGGAGLYAYQKAKKKKSDKK